MAPSRRAGSGAQPGIRNLWRSRRGARRLARSSTADSLISGLGAGLFFAFSYTFWTQAVTAEVYTLHLLIVGAAGLALTAWADRPTVSRLAVFYAVFALGFGNDLSMVLLLPGFTTFSRPCTAIPAAKAIRCSLECC